MGQGVLFTLLESTGISEEELRMLSNPLVAGVTLFERNFKSLNQLKSLVQELRSVKPELIIAVDHEGGRVQRFKQGFTQIPSMRSLVQAASENPEQCLRLLKAVGWLLAIELREVGIDLNFGPVLDLDQIDSAIIGERSFGQIPQQVVAHAGALIQGMQSAGMRAVGKHFPGHGGVSEDSHLTTPEDNRALGDLEKADLAPYQGLLGSLGGVMTAHILYPKVDKEITTFSSKWLKDILRHKMGFAGAIITDDLMMIGATGVADPTQRVEKAWVAGADVALWCNDSKALAQTLDDLKGQSPDPLIAQRVGRLKAEPLSQGDRENGWLETRKKLARDVVESIHGKLDGQARMAELTEHF